MAMQERSPRENEFVGKLQAERGILGVIPPQYDPELWNTFRQYDFSRWGIEAGSMLQVGAANVINYVEGPRILDGFRDEYEHNAWWGERRAAYKWEDPDFPDLALDFSNRNQLNRRAIIVAVISINMIADCVELPDHLQNELELLRKFFKGDLWVPRFGSIHYDNLSPQRKLEGMEDFGQMENAKEMGKSDVANRLTRLSKATLTHLFSTKPENSETPEEA